MPRDPKSTNPPGTPKARAYHHGDLRRELLSAAQNLLAEVGPNGVTIRALAAQVGVSHMALYRHFDNRDDLVSELAEACFQQLAGRLGRAIAAGSDEPSRVLRRVIRAYVLYAVEHSAAYRLMFATGIPLGSRFEAVAGLGYDRILEVVQECLAAINPGTRSPAEQDRIATVACGMLHGLATLAIEGSIPKGRPVEALMDTATSLIISGLAERI